MGIKSKKGLSASFLVITIITIASFILIASTLARFYGDSNDTKAEALCKSSIALRAKTATTFSSDAQEEDYSILRAKLKPVPALCKTIDKEVVGNREEIKDQFAQKMAKCWEMFGEGRYDEILTPSSASLVFHTQNHENECFNCYTMTLPEEIPGGRISGEEMFRYLRNTNHPKVANTSYLDYIQGFGGPGRVLFTAPFISEKQSYTISMMPRNKPFDEDSAFWTGVTKVAVGGAIVLGVAAGALCIVGTGGACVAVLGAGAGSTVGTGIGLGLLTTAKVVGTGALVAGTGAAGYTAYTGVNDVMSSLYGERDVSSIYVGFTEFGQQMCGSGDIAGE